MHGSHAHKNDAILRLQFADAVNEADIDQFPARHRLIHDFTQGFFRHGRIMFERQGRDALTFVEVAHEADEACHGTDFCIACVERIDLCAWIEVGFLYKYFHHNIKVSSQQRMVKL